MSVAGYVRVEAQDATTQRGAILKLLVPMLVVLFGFEAPGSDLLLASLIGRKTEGGPVAALN